MPNLSIADKATLDAINTKAGTNTDGAGTTTIFARLKQIYDYLTGNLSSTRAAKIDNLDVTISSRAPASTALSTATWTATRAAKLDSLDRLQAQSVRLIASDTVRAQSLTERNIQASDGYYYYSSTRKSFYVPYSGIVRIKAEVRVDANPHSVSIIVRSHHTFKWVENPGTTTYEGMTDNQGWSTTSAVYVPMSIDLRCIEGDTIGIGLSCSNGGDTGATVTSYIKNVYMCYDYTSTIESPVVILD